MKVLSIGNSFSTDAHKWLHKLAEINGVNLETSNLFIGGCSLETHWKNFTENNADYSFEINGNEGEKMISITEALASEKWDVVTFQQASHFSGMEETYEPYLTSLADAVKEVLPQAKLYFHQTWAYETDSLHPGFADYNHSQQEMFERIVSASQKAAKAIDAEIIPTGSVVQKLRKTVPEFDYTNGGISLCRDGFHLSFDYGRFAAATVWLRTLTDKKIKCDAFEDFDTALLNKILEVVNII
ncbi:MAG: DUF4886 domain-containing protein [Clostridia bacterium]|nr:DUF4886 domain-containing protein [Clostridia bacterium]